LQDFLVLCFSSCSRQCCTGAWS